jgi:hypothetical protein
MSDEMGGSKAKDLEDAVFPVSEMVACVIKALQPGGEGAPDKGGLKLRREFTELRKHLAHPAYQGALPLCREWIRPLGFESSILLAYILEQNRHYLGNGMTQEGYFELDYDQIETELCIDRAQFHDLVDKLRVNQIIMTREATDEKGNRRTLYRVNPGSVKANLKDPVGATFNKPEIGANTPVLPELA